MCGPRSGRIIAAGMGGSHSGAATRGRRAATHTLTVAALALLALAGSARAAMAQPVAVITAAPAAVTHDVSPRFAFGVDGTDPVRFECRLDGALADCASDGATGSYTASELAAGAHTFSVRATEADPGAEEDWGPAAAYDFRVERTAPSEAPPAPTVIAPRSEPAVTPAPAPVAAAPAPARVPRVEIGTACMEVSASRANARLTL